jgi:transposase-like protein
MAVSKQRTIHQSRIDWWRGQFQRQHKANLSVSELCRQLDVSVTTFYYWKKRVHASTPNDLGQVPDGRRLRDPAPTAGAAAPNFVPVSILDSATVTELEIVLANASVVRLKGAIDPALLQAAIVAAGQLDGSRQGAH